MGLCHACQHRRMYLEEGSGARSECKSNGSVSGCYMFENVIPLSLIRREGDDRPQFAGAMFSARSNGVKHDEEFILDLVEHEDGSNTAYWKPKPKTKEKLMAKQIKAGKKTIAPKPASSGPVGKSATNPLRGK